MTVVRHAIQDDFDALFDILVESHKEDLPRLFPYDYGKVKAIIERSTLQRGGITGIIEDPESPGYIVGIVRLILDEWEWSRCGFIQLRQLYVRPQYRKGTGYANALMEFAEKQRAFIEERVPDHPPVLLEYAFINRNPREFVLMDRLFRRWGMRVGSVYTSGLR